MLTDLWRMISSPLARKFQLALVGLLLSAATGGLLPAPVAVWVILGVNALTAAGVFVIPNGPSAVLPAAPKDPQISASTPDVPVVEAPAVVVEPFDRGSAVG